MEGGTVAELSGRYSPQLLRKDTRGYYHCFFRGCGKRLRFNFSDHLRAHENSGTAELDLSIVQQLQDAAAAATATPTPDVSRRQDPTDPAPTQPTPPHSWDRTPRMVGAAVTKICVDPLHESSWSTNPELPSSDFDLAVIVSQLGQAPAAGLVCRKCALRAAANPRAEALPEYPPAANAAFLGSQATWMTLAPNLRVDARPVPLTYYPLSPSWPAQYPPPLPMVVGFKTENGKEGTGAVVAIEEAQLPVGLRMQPPVDSFPAAAFLSAPAEGGGRVLPVVFTRPSYDPCPLLRDTSPSWARCSDFLMNLDTVLAESTQDAGGEGDAAMDRAVSSVELITNNLQQHRYRSAKEFADDIRAHWTDFFPSLPPDSVLREQASSLEKALQKLVADEANDKPDSMTDTGLGEACCACGQLGDPLERCQGFCRRFIHRWCQPQESPRDRLLCLECSTGKPVLHYDSIKREYFYYWCPRPVRQPQQLQTPPQEGAEGVAPPAKQVSSPEFYYDAVWSCWRPRKSPVVSAAPQRAISS